MKHPEFDQMVALAERLRLELDSSDRQNLVGSQINPDKSHYRTMGLGPISLVRLPRLSGVWITSLGFVIGWKLRKDKD
jgi:hypothetical protein